MVKNGPTPHHSALNYNTILQLDLFCRREGKVRSPVYTGFLCLERKHLLIQKLWACSLYAAYNFLQSYDQPRQHIKNQRHYFANKGLSCQCYGFSCSHVSMWELDYKESWAMKNWCFWTVVLEKTLESPLDCKEIKPVNPKGNQSWMFIGRTDAKVKLQYFGHLMWKANSLEKTLTLAEGEGGSRRWDGYMASLTQWTWIWANFSRQWRTGKPGVLQSMGLQRVGHNWVTEQQQLTVRWLGPLNLNPN